MTSHPIFNFSKDHFGGTEIMAMGFLSKILPEMKNIQNYKCVILPGHIPDLTTWGADGQKTILWVHNNISQFVQSVGRILNNALIKKNTEYYIAVSEYQKSVLAKELDLPLDKIKVIPNAIVPIEPTAGKFNNIDKVKIIHASTADRGMRILLDAVPLIEEDFELNIFNDFYPDLPHSYNIDGVNDPRVNFYGKTPRKTLYKFFADAHIHAYPSIIPETSCLAQMEALSAGCYTVHTDFGALSETSMGHGKMIPIDELTPERYAEELTKAIRTIKENGYDYTKQVKDIEDNFTWEKAKQNWLAFDATI
jgi:UDP-glucose:(glucosyl)LPS alpha-1,2-glucosyltransferase